MEEKKGSLKVEMEPKAQEQQQKLSYEELNKVCIELSQQAQYLQNQVNHLNMSNMFKRLDYLFKVIENAEAFGDQMFVGKCVDEIKEAMYSEEPSEEKKEA